VRPDTVFMPFHWAGPGGVNAVVDDALDPTSRMPQLKTCAATVERVEVP